MGPELEPAPPKEPRKGWRPPLRLVVLGIAAAVLLVFMLQNLAEVTIIFLFWTMRINLIWALLTASGLGFLIGFFARRRRRVERELPK
jgi:uncharacterized integral membrane protein